MPRPGVTSGRARHPEEPALAADEQIELMAVDAAARVVGDDTAIVDIATPRWATGHRPALEQRHVQQRPELDHPAVDRDGPKRLQRPPRPRGSPRGRGDLEARLAGAVAAAPDIEDPTIMELPGALQLDL